MGMKKVLRTLEWQMHGYEKLQRQEIEESLRKGQNNEKDEGSCN